ncbi:MAG: HAMP domain-containing histidine kinase [Chloroflexi bacterium]|nr:MAG: putative two-component sensor histidine kinase [Chloroflexi bacterium OLB13]MBC6957200.1 sensor histidine kinase [Chloroflexota bacterium]MBV6438233.1 Adaptive-response sensory-kinase SasA [Anaerolineae bacterium]MDL1916694.1 HAMP domain-containing histidine kinase [Anaerolineae bacterium CFX4]OQY83636.1 MAG: hypothetical protein B6D42_07150 [Anaerolineae bacterium UTCFX5]
MTPTEKDTGYLAEVARLASEPVTERAIESILDLLLHDFGLLHASVKSGGGEMWQAGTDPGHGPVRTLSLNHRGRPLGALTLRFTEDSTGERQDHPILHVTARLLGSLLRDRELDLAEREVEAYRDRMLRLVTHDLRTPLAQIIGYAHLMQMDVADNAMLLRFVNGIINATSSMDKLLESLLRLERIRHSPRELYEPVAVVALAQTAVEDCMDGADQKNITLVAHLDSHTDAFVMGDAFLLQRAMENLVTNALKFTLPEGTVTVSLTFSDSTMEYRVKDTGIGIPAEQLDSVFVPFYSTGSRRAKSTSGGFGLGLSLVTSIVEEHQGSVFVESTVGEGSEFGFRLPLARD